MHTALLSVRTSLLMSLNYFTKRRSKTHLNICVHKQQQKNKDISRIPNESSLYSLFDVCNGNSVTI